MYGLLDGLHGIGQHAAVVAGQEHAPLGQRHKQRVMQLEFHRQVEVYPVHPKPGSSNVCLQAGQDGVVGRVSEGCDLEIGGQTDLQHIGRLFGWSKCLWVGAAKRHQPGLEGVPQRWVEVGGPAQRGVNAWDTCQIGQGWHVHDGHAGHFGSRDGLHQVPHLGIAVLWLLHCQTHQVVVPGFCLKRCQGIQLARALVGIDFNQAAATLD